MWQQDVTRCINSCYLLPELDLPRADRSLTVPGTATTQTSHACIIFTRWLVAEDKYPSSEVLGAENDMWNTHREVNRNIWQLPLVAIVSTRKPSNDPILHIAAPIDILKSHFHWVCTLWTSQALEKWLLRWS
jgi:hypothetical protein